jgi:hypothetical protein
MVLTCSFGSLQIPVHHDDLVASVGDPSRLDVSTVSVKREGCVIPGNGVDLGDYSTVGAGVFLESVVEPVRETSAAVTRIDDDAVEVHERLAPLRPPVIVGAVVRSSRGKADCESDNGSVVLDSYGEARHRQDPGESISVQWTKKLNRLLIQGEDRSMVSLDEVTDLHRRTPQRSCRLSGRHATP